MRRRAAALTLSLSHPTLSRGVHLDLAVFQSMSVLGVAVIVGIKAEEAVYRLPSSIVRDQLEVAREARFNAAKIGCMPDIEHARGIADILSSLDAPAVLQRKTDDSCVDAIELARALRDIRKILVLDTVGAREISGLWVGDLSSAGMAARRIEKAYGVEEIVIRGIKDAGKCITVIYTKGSLTTYTAECVPRGVLGVMEAFSAAVTASLARGMSLEGAIAEAEAVITEASSYHLDISTNVKLVNPTTRLEVPAEKYRVLEDLKEALKLLIANEGKVARLVPEVQMNIAMALPSPYARTPLDVAAIPGRIARYRDKLIVRATPEFGASRHLSRLILAAMRVDPRIRSVGNIVASREVRDALEGLGYNVVEYVGEKPLSSVIEDWSIVPDAVVTNPALGREALTLIFAERASIVASRIVRVAEEVARA